MAVPILSDKAEADFRQIILKSYERFGNLAAERYKKLLEVAMLEVANNPQSKVSKPYHKGKKTVRIYHVRYSRQKAAIDGVTVQASRHFVAYVVRADGRVEIVRLLHDGMDFSRHL